MLKRSNISVWLTLPVVIGLVLSFSISYVRGANSDALHEAADLPQQQVDLVSGQRFAPALDPPKVDLDIGLAAPDLSRALKTAPGVEWAFHKTSDNAHPDGNEQQMLWLVNRARSDPTTEGIRLADSTDPDTVYALQYFDVDLDVLRNEFAAIDPKPPAAFDVRLYHAAKAHCEDLIARDAQDHDQQFDRITTAGFTFVSARGIVFSYALSALYAHDGFNIDWGPGDDTGMQPGRGHRLAIMSVDGDFANAGLAAVSESDTSTNVGPLVVTGNFCKANPTVSDHYNRFLVGTVWGDDNNNSRYDPGEGIGGVTVMPDQGNYYAVTSDSGGYAIPITASGQYTVVFSGSAITGTVVKTATLGAESVLLDYLLESAAEAPYVSTGAATSVRSTSAAVNGTVDPNAVSATWYFEYGPTASYGRMTTGFTATQSGSIIAYITGLSPGTNYHYRILATNTAGTSYGSDRTFTSLSASDRSQVEAFVTRFYQECLGRPPDQTGLDDWVDALVDGTRTGADVAQGFIFSPEFIDQANTDGDFLTILYAAFFNRAPDPAGNADWLGQLESGVSRGDVLDGFIYAVEFADLCNDYGILAFSEDPATDQIAAFVTRFYRQCLDREPDNAGLTAWVNDLRDDALTGADLATNFVFSTEFISQGKTNDEYLTILYRAFFNREPDSAGFNLWQQALEDGMSRLEVLNGFTGAQEFVNLCAGFGITPR